MTSFFKVWRRLMRRFLTLFFTAVLLSGLATNTRSQESEPVRKVMNLKLDYVQKILISIIKQEFGKLEDLSFQLVVLTGTEDWKVIRSEEYNRHTAEFVRAVEALRGARVHRDIEESAKAYADMTASCVQCHKYVHEYMEALNK
jgi:hypothetical protein